MSDATTEHEAIIARLDALIAAVDRLTLAVTGSTVNAADSVVTPVAASTAPTTPAAEAGGQATVAAAPAPAPDAGPDVDVTVDDQVVLGIPGPGADPRATIQRMFQAVLGEDKEVVWRELTALTHPQELAAPRAIDSMKAFSWKQLKRNAGSYLDDGQPGSFVVVRTDPAELSDSEGRVKIFLQAAGRSPAPLTLRRDESAGGAWRLGQISL
ncbi:MAG: hypothetical protein QF464_07845 [Myxococcota bacterium]|nr:hypothetical protein [Myxococcota bacterium]